MLLFMGLWRGEVSGHEVLENFVALPNDGGAFYSNPSALDESI